MKSEKLITAARAVAGRMLSAHAPSAHAPAARAMAARAVAAAALAGMIAACAGAPPATGPTTRFQYRVPSPSSGLYHIEDSLSVGVSTPVGDMEVTTTTLLTMNMVFGRDPGGVGVFGTVIGFNATSTNSLTGTRTADAGDVTGPLALVLGRRGHVEVGAMPALDSAVADLSPFPGVAFDLFPQLPDRAVGHGGSWVDTVNWSVVDGPATTTSNTVYTYTLMGDTLVGDRTLLRIDVSGDVRLETVQGEGEMESSQELSGSITGHVLWDSETSLPAYVESHRELEGTNSVPGAGAISMTISGPVRIVAAFQQEERRRRGVGGER